MFANRTNWELIPNEMTQLREALIRQGIKIIDLTESNPTRCGFSYLGQDLLKPFVDSRNVQYQPSAYGLLEARQAVCRYYLRYGLPVDPKRVILTASTSEAYSFLFRLLANPAETVLFPCPSYPLFEFLVDLNDVHSGTYPLVYDDGWRVDLVAFESVIMENPKAVVLVNPNNPTGSFIKPAEMETIGALCRSQSVPIISDEVFLDYRHQDSASAVSLLQTEQCLSFTLGGLSKTLGLPQMKLSWMIVNGPDDLVNEALARLEVIADAYLSVNTPVQNALPYWLEKHVSIQAEIKNRLQQNRTFLHKAVSERKDVRCLKSEGGWYAMLRLYGSWEEEPLVLTLLHEDHICVHPGYFYDYLDQTCLVISLLLPVPEFQEGIFRLLKRLDAR
jgi:aspartate/methionine/tyrosine aminotransferase